MSEEKKLTDEEFIHDLEEFERDIDINETGLYTKILDLIRRLQYDNSSAHKASDEWREKYETLKNELKKELAEHEEFTKKAKAEIERLTEENKQYFAENERLNNSCGIYQIKLEQQIKETYVYLLRDIVSEHMKEEIAFLVFAALNTIFCLVLIGIFVTLLVMFFRREKLTLTEQERIERKEQKAKQKLNKNEEKKNRKIISLTQKIEKLQQKGDK